MERITESKYAPMTKEMFVKAINEIKNYHTKLDNIQTVLEENCQDAVFWPPTLEDTLVNVLEDCLNDKTDLVGYFIYELEFGSEWERGRSQDDGKDSKLSTPEELYDYLIAGLN